MNEELLEEKKDMELEFESEVPYQSGISDTTPIIEQNNGKDKGKTLNSGYSRLQRAFKKVSIDLEENKIYTGKIISWNKRNVNENLIILSLNIDIFVEKDISKEINIDYFFNENDLCLELTLTKLNNLYKMFSKELSLDDVEDVNSLLNALKKIIGSYVEVKFTTRKDEKTQKDYRNYDIISVLKSEDVEE